jgi:hypothetical protein
LISPEHSVERRHCPPVVKAIQEQAAKFLRTCFGVAVYDLYLDVVNE